MREKERELSGVIRGLSGFSMAVRGLQGLSGNIRFCEGSSGSLSNDPESLGVNKEGDQRLLGVWVFRV